MNRHSSLTVWPEAVKAIIMASAVHNIEGPSDIPSFQDLKDGAGAIDAALADTIATTRQDSGVVCNNPCWWGVTTSSTNPSSGGSIYQYFTASRGERIRVAISWFASADAPATPPNLARDELLTNYQLYVYKPSGGALIGYTASWDNNYELADFIAPETGQYQIRIYRQPEGDYNESSNSIGIAWVKDATYLPDLRNKDGWVSTIYVRSYAQETRHIEIPFFNTYGQKVGSTACDTYPNSNSQCHLRVDNTGGLPADTLGSGIVNGGEDLTVVVHQQYDNELDESNSFSVAGGSGSLGWEQTGTTLFAPVIKYNYYNRTSLILVQNTTPNAAIGTIQFYNAIGGSMPISLTANGSAALTPPTYCNSNYGFCSAKITSDQPLAVVILEQNHGAVLNRTTHNALSAGALRNFAPVVKKNWGGQSSSLTVQNVGTLPTSISVTCYPSGGGTVDCGSISSVPSMNTVVFALSNLSTGYGSAVISSTGVSGNPAQPLATLIYESGTPYKLTTSAPLTGTLAAYAPELYGNYVEGQTWNSGLQIQNVGESSASVSITYYNRDGTHPWTPTLAFLQPKSMQAFSCALTTMPCGFVGSAVIVSSQPIVATVNTANNGSGDTKASYTAPNR